MAKFKASDKVRVNGQLMTIGSWPDDDQGPFYASYVNPEGGEVSTTLYASQTAVELVEEGTGVESTAGDLSQFDSLHQEQDDIDADASRKSGDQPVTPAENARAAAGLTDADDVHSVTPNGEAVPTPSDDEPEAEDETVDDGSAADEEPNK